MIDSTELQRRAQLWAQGKWEIPDGIDTTTFDFAWRPSMYDRPYIHQFGTQWQKTGGPRYVVPEAEGVKYHDSQRAVSLPRPQKFVKKFDNAVLDWSWHPDDTEPPYIYVFGNQFISSYECSTIEYAVDGATEYKHVENIAATLTSTPENWKILHDIDRTLWDFAWVPHPYEPPYIYVWGNEYLPPEQSPTVEYHVPGATEYKYMHDRVAKLYSNPECWVVHKSISTTFDMTWAPHPYDPPYIYVWGNQFLTAEQMPTVEYRVPGATEYKYMTDIIAKLVNDRACWNTLHAINMDSFDWEWVPHPYDPPYIYVWGNQFLSAQEMPTVEYRMPDATEYKYMTDAVATLVNNRDYWHVLHSIDQESFDWTWAPHPWNPPYIYVWGNQWNDAATEPTVEYRMPGATQCMYMNEGFATVVPDKSKWTVSEGFKNSAKAKEFDYSWRPNPHSPPQIYQWENDGPIYTVTGAQDVVLMTWNDITLARPGATSLSNNHSKKSTKKSTSLVPQYTVTTTLQDLVEEHQDEVFWALNPDINYDKFDFSWKPDSHNFRHVNVFGNAEIKDTQTYYINGPLYKIGHRQFNYVEVDFSFDTNLTMIWVDMGNSTAQNHKKIVERFPNIQRVRFIGSWVETINRAIKKSRTKLCWILCSYYDYTDFEFDFYPSKWQINQLHVFGTQHSHWGHTYLVNTDVFPEATKYVKVIEHLQNINHVRNRKAKAVSNQFDIIYIDHGVNVEQHDLDKTIHYIRYSNSYLETLRNWISTNPQYVNLDNYKVWVTSNIVDLDSFDFSWYPDPFQNKQLHVFASQSDRVRQKFGDVMLVNMSELSSVMDDMITLEDYPKKVNYIGHLTAQRLPHPVIEHEFDSHVSALSAMQNVTYWPYYQLRTKDSGSPQHAVPSLWSVEHKKIIVTSHGGTDIFVPHEAIDYVRDELYDYPLIDKVDKLYPSSPLDIIFISNGEPVAESNWDWLCSTLKKRNIKNRVVRIKDVDGRIASQHAAAAAANTGWYFLVNAKIKINENFDWSWQPDRLQKQKHYIFTVTNPVNDLEYGHQAIVANNRELTISTTQPRGLDFTLDSPHEVVDINCGVALYNTDPWTTWRTAFRECVKLSQNNDAESLHRLETWRTVARGDNADWSIRGCVDALNYVKSVSSDINQLLHSYDWGWLENHYNHLYNSNNV